MDKSLMLILNTNQIWEFIYIFYTSMYFYLNSQIKTRYIIIEYFKININQP